MTVFLIYRAQHSGELAFCINTQEKELKNKRFLLIFRWGKHERKSKNYAQLNDILKQIW